MNNRIKYLRENLYITQQEMANKLNIARSTYSEYENGDTIPPLKKLCIISKICNVSLDYILGLNKDKTPYDKILDFNEEKLLYNIKNLRISHNYSKTHLGKLTSYDRSVITRYENGEAKVSVAFIIKISKLYNVHSDYIVGIVAGNT